MNFWKIQAAARRKSRARNDIMGLLENCQRRKRKTKKTQPVIRKQFGIFARSLSFKVRLNENNEYEPVGNGKPKSDGRTAVQKPIDRNKNVAQKQRHKTKKNGTSVRNRMQEFDVVDLIDDNDAAAASNDTDQHGKSNSETVNDNGESIPPKRTPNPNAMRDNEGQKHQNDSDFLEVFNPVDFREESVDFTIGTLDVTAQKSNKIRQRNPLDELDVTNKPQKSVSSIDFNGFDSHIEAADNNLKASADFGHFSNDFTQSTSNNSKSDGSKQSGWSTLNTPSFSQELNSNLTTEMSFQVYKRAEQSSETVLTGIDGNNLTGIPSLSQCFSCHPTHQAFQFDANTNKDIYNSQQSVSSDGISSFNSCDESTDKNTTFDSIEATTDIKPFTMSMVIGRKSMGAHRAYERIFGRKTQRQQSTLPPMPAKSSMPSTIFCKNTLKKPIQIM